MTILILYLHVLQSDRTHYEDSFEIYLRCAKTVDALWLVESNKRRQ